MQPKNILLIISILSSSLAAYAQPDADKPILDKAQVIVQDLVVQGSECVGLDCANGESFGFDTQRLKENNLRIHFNDTSVSASFPTNDWRILINDTGNGGTNHFSVEDSDAGRVPFRIEAGAASHSLVVEADGDIGMGTLDPEVELHVVDGDSPTLRLEQNGSSGFTPQTWDVAGNEANFFVRDVTNGSELPFKIKPGAPDNSLYIDTDGDVGLGTASPDGAFEVVAGIDGQEDFVINADGTTVSNYSGTGFGYQIKRTDFGTNGSIVAVHAAAGDPQIRFNRDGSPWAIGNNAGTFEIVNDFNVGDGDDQGLSLDAMGNMRLSGALSASQGMTISDYRFKRNVSSFDKGLEIVNNLNPVYFEYKDIPGVSNSSNGSQIGLIAQEVQKVFPEIVKSFNTDEKDKDYLQIVESEIKYALINAIQEQQKLIESQAENIQKLTTKIEDLSQEINQIKNSSQGNISLDQKPEAFIRQSFPNPTNGFVTIEYNIPNAKGNYTLTIVNTSTGSIVKRVNLDPNSNMISLNLEHMSSGSYTYQLLANSQIIDQRKLQIVK